MTEGQNRTQTGRLILFTILWLTLFVLSVKVSTAWATRSLSLMAESLYTLLTSFSTLLSLLKITAPERPTGWSVYGHGKRETIITFLLVALLSFVGLNLLGMAGQQLVAATQEEGLMLPIRVSLPLMQLLGGVVVTSLGLALFSFYKAKVLRNRVLHYNASQLFKDAGLTLLALAGLLGVSWGWVWLDSVLAIVLVLLVVISSWQVVSWQLPLLVQQTAIAPEILAQMARQVGGVTHCDKIQSRGIVGRLVYIQMHLVIHPEFSGVTALIAERIKGIIQERYGPIHAIFYIDDSLAGRVSLNGSTPRPEANGQNDQN